MFLFPAGLIVPARLRLKPQHWLINSRSQSNARNSQDRLSTPREWRLVSTYNRLRSSTPKPRGARQLDSKWLKPEYGIKSPGVLHKLTLLQSVGKGYSTAALIQKQMPLYTVKPVVFLPLSHSNVPAVETWCPLHRRAPCSRSRSPPPPQSQRSGRWAPRRSLSPPRSPTDSRRLRGSYCPQTVHERTGPWFWLQPSGDLHTLWTEKLSWAVCW